MSWRKREGANPVQERMAERIRPEHANDQCYRSLAAAVFAQAFQDIQLRGPLPDRAVSSLRDRPQSFRQVRLAQRAAALDFLFAPEYANPRQMWLAWLGLTEHDLWMMLARRSLRGSRNALAKQIARRLEAVGVASYG